MPSPISFLIRNDLIDGFDDATSEQQSTIRREREAEYKREQQLTIEQVEQVRAKIKRAFAIALGVLDEIEKTILRLRYGADYGYSFTAKEVSEIMGITAQAVRARERKALAKLLQLKTGKEILEAFGVEFVP